MPGRWPVIPFMVGKAQATTI
ncbi:hypothetical protein CBM2586_B80023 [Cupriavidus phytorum]|uniref:Uncharacterized protein n=1 Tax=Cupriavidus taiwanensis TaxID=164546 RepID=A0A375CLZ2_9BURK|nr:hypothetical protein CBM2586_B80023 [Cupriavidus taiwanensis]